MKYLLSICLLLGCIHTFSQDSLYQAKSRLFATYPQEHLYLQTSKDIYESGEDLWFKVYHLDAYSLGRSTASQTLYLEMVNERDSIVWQEKYPAKEGITLGHVYLSESLPSGDYVLRACTRNSCYDDTLLSVCHRRVQIVKFITGGKKKILSVENTDSIRFALYPEGGYLVHGLPCRLAFKGTNGHGRPVSLEGSLYKNDTLLTTFKSIHDGMGSFMFVPDVNEKYFVQLTNGRKYPLPEIQRTGMTLQFIRQTDETVDFYVLQSAGLSAQKVCLMGQLRGVIGCMAQGVVKDRLKISVSLKEFPYQGIAEFTLYNAEMQPLSERLVYIHPEKKLYVTAKMDKDLYELREKATLHVTVKDEAGNPVPNANLGVSVFDSEYENAIYPMTMLSYNYLISQLRGEIYNAPWYFDESNADRLRAMDLLLLTQGWRRYVWNSQISSNYKGKPFLTEGITGKQIIPGKRKAKRLNGISQLIRVSTPGDQSQFIEVNMLGDFDINPDVLSDLSGSYLYLKPMLQNKFNPKLMINNPFIQLDSLCRLKPRCLVEKFLMKETCMKEDTYRDKAGVILLDEVLISKKRKSHALRDKFMSGIDSLFQSKYGPWVCEHGYLENYMPGFTHFHNPLYCLYPQMAKERIQPVIGKIYRISKVRVEGDYWQIDVDMPINYKGPLVNYDEEDMLRMNSLWRTKSYYGVREFYQPDEVDMQASVPDARNTLLWKPSLTTDSKGEATVDFYCSDINTKFIYRIEGVDNVGLLGSVQSEFRVYKKDVIQEVEKEEYE